MTSSTAGDPPPPISSPPPTPTINVTDESVAFSPIPPPATPQDAIVDSPAADGTDHLLPASISSPPKPRAISAHDKLVGDQMLKMEFELLGALEDAVDEQQQQKQPDDALVRRPSLAVQQRQRRISARPGSNVSASSMLAVRPAILPPVTAAEISPAFGSAYQSITLKDKASARLYATWSRLTGARHSKRQPLSRRARFTIAAVVAFLVVAIITVILLFTLLGCSPLGCRVENISTELNASVFGSGDQSTATTARLSSHELEDFPRVRQMVDYLISTIPDAKTSQYSTQIRFVNVTTKAPGEIPVIPFDYSLFDRTAGEDSRESVTDRNKQPVSYLPIGLPFCGRLDAINPIMGMWASNEIPTTLRVTNNSMTSAVRISNYTDTANHETASDKEPIKFNGPPAAATDLPYCCMEFFALGFNDFKRVQRSNVDARLYCKTGPEGGIWAGWNDVVDWSSDPEKTWVSQVQTGLSLGQRFKAQPDNYETVAAFFTASLNGIGPGVMLRSQALVPMNLFSFHQTISQNPDALGIRLSMSAYIPTTAPDTLSSLSQSDAQFSLDYDWSVVDTSRLIPSPWPVAVSSAASTAASVKNSMHMQLVGPYYKSQYAVKLNGRMVYFSAAGCPHGYSRSGTFCIANTLTAADLQLNVQKTKARLVLPNDSDLVEVVVSRIRPMFNRVPLVWANSKLQMYPFGIPNMPMQLDFVLPFTAEDSSLSRWKDRNDNGRTYVMRDGASASVPQSEGTVSNQELLGGDWWEVETGMQAQLRTSSRTGEIIIAYKPPTEMPNCLLVRLGLPVPDVRLSVRDFCLGSLDWVSNSTIAMNATIFGSNNATMQASTTKLAARKRDFVDTSNDTMTTVQTQLPSVYDEGDKPEGTLVETWSDVLKYQAAIKSVLLQTVRLAAANNYTNSSDGSSENFSLGMSVVNSNNSFGARVSKWQPLDVYTESLLLSGDPMDYVKDKQAQSLTLFQLPLAAPGTATSGNSSSKTTDEAAAALASQQSDSPELIQLRTDLDPAVRQLINFFNASQPDLEGMSLKRYLVAAADSLQSARGSGRPMKVLLAESASIMKRVGKFAAQMADVTAAMKPQLPQFLKQFNDWQQVSTSVSDVSMPQVWLKLLETLRAKNKDTKFRLAGLGRDLTPVDTLSIAMAMEVSQGMSMVWLRDKNEPVEQASQFFDSDSLSAALVAANAEITLNDTQSGANSTPPPTDDKKKKQADKEVCRGTVCQSWSVARQQFNAEMAGRARSYVTSLASVNAPRTLLPSEIDILLDVTADDKKNRDEEAIRELISHLFERKKIVRSAWMTGIYVEMVGELVLAAQKNNLFDMNKLVSATGPITLRPSVLRLMTTFTQLSLLSIKTLASMSGLEVAVWQAMDVAAYGTDPAAFLQILFDLHSTAGIVSMADGQSTRSQSASTQSLPDAPQ